MALKDFVLPYIANGSKRLEIRVADEKRKKVQVGDSIVFCELHRRVVKAIRRYDSFAQMLEAEDPNWIMPGYSPKQILTGLRQFYNPGKESLGILVFELEAVTKT